MLILSPSVFATWAYAFGLTLLAALAGAPVPAKSSNRVATPHTAETTYRDIWRFKLVLLLVVRFPDSTAVNARTPAARRGRYHTHWGNQTHNPSVDSLSRACVRRRSGGKQPSVCLPVFSRRRALDMPGYWPGTIGDPS